MAALGGIHGNLPALDAVFCAIDQAGIHTIMNTGNSVVGYPWPNEVVSRLQARRQYSVQGDLDRLVTRVRRKAGSLKVRTDPQLLEALQWTSRVLLSSHLEYLGTLPKRVTVTVEGLSVFLCHGTPASQTDRLTATDEESRFRRQREYANVHVVVMGGGHEPFWRMVDGTLFVNPGSVGIEEGNAPMACYAVISTEGDPWSVEFHRVSYDPSLLPQRLAEVGLARPWPVA